MTIQRERDVKFEFIGVPSNNEVHGFFYSGNRFSAMARLQKQYNKTLPEWKHALLTEVDGDTRTVVFHKKEDGKPHVVLAPSNNTGLTPEVRTLLERAASAPANLPALPPPTPVTTSPPPPTPEIDVPIKLGYTIKEA